MSNHNMFLRRIKKNVNSFWLKNAAYLELNVFVIQVNSHFYSKLKVNII